MLRAIWRRFRRPRGFVLNDGRIAYLLRSHKDLAWLSDQELEQAGMLLIKGNRSSRKKLEQVRAAFNARRHEERGSSW